jgi:putative Mg2+ transporter-C (MgtC) family protein
MHEFFIIPDVPQLATICARLLASVLLGALIGVERQSFGKPAGLRTHMLVALGATLFVLVPAEVSRVESGDVGRAIQGVAAGIGFIGAGTIMKVAEREEVTGLTTAAGIWLTAGLGIAVAIGPLWIAAVAAFAGWLILSVLRMLEGGASPAGGR